MSEPNVYRPGGPIALVTNRCLFSFADGRFTLASVHPGHTVEEVIENTGFDFDRPANGAGNAGALARDAQADARGGGAAAGRGLSAVRGQVFGVGEPLSRAESDGPSGAYAPKLVCRPKNQTRGNVR